MAVSFDPFTELDRLAAGLLGTRQGPKVMPVDLYRDGDRYVLNADMPGIDPGSVDIDVDGQLLTIRANRTPDTRDGDRYVLNADMPGIDPGSVDIDVDGQLLTIRANRTPDTRDGVKWLSQERPHGSYLRQFSVGEGIDSNAITAHYDNGVLSLVIPVSERAKPRKIEVTAGPATEPAVGAPSAERRSIDS
jgi:HSP20 family protein